jgi:hypothetical protein
MQLFRRGAPSVHCEAALPEPHYRRLLFSNILMSNPMRRSEAARDMEANVILGGETRRPSRDLVRRIPLLSDRSLIRTSLGPLISIICHISLPVR